MSYLNFFFLGNILIQYLKLISVSKFVYVLWHQIQFLTLFKYLRKKYIHNFSKCSCTSCNDFVPKEC